MIRSRKIKLCFLYVSLTLWVVNGFAQRRKIDSLLNVLRVAKEDTIKVNVYNLLGDIFQKINADTSIYFHDKAIAWCNSILKSGVKESVNNIVAFKKADITRGKGWDHYINGNYPGALDNYHATLDMVTQLEKSYPDYGTEHLKLKAAVYDNIGVVYLGQANYPKALDNYMKALKIHEQLKHKGDLGSVLCNIGNLYFSQGDHERALNYFFRALKINREDGNKQAIALNLGNVGNIYAEQGAYSKALNYFLRALKISEELHDKQQIADNYIRLGVVFGYLPDYEKSLRYSFEGLKMYEQIGSKFGMALSLDNISSIYLRTGNYKDAETYFKRALSLSKEIGDLEGIKEANKGLSFTDSVNGNFKGAFEHFREYILIRDSISNEENTKKQTQIEMQFEFDKKQAADSVRVAEEKKVATAELRSEKNKSYSLYGGLGLVIVFAGFMYNRFRITQKQKKIIEEQKQVVEEQKKIVEERNKEVMDSIYYARRIQRSLLPSEKYLKKIIRK